MLTYFFQRILIKTMLKKGGLLCTGHSFKLIELSIFPSFIYVELPLLRTLEEILGKTASMCNSGKGVP